MIYSKVSYSEYAIQNCSNLAIHASKQSSRKRLVKMDKILLNCRGRVILL